LPSTEIAGLHYATLASFLPMHFLSHTNLGEGDRAAAAARWGCAEGWVEGGGRLVFGLSRRHTHRCAVAGCLSGRERRGGWLFEGFA